MQTFKKYFLLTTFTESPCPWGASARGGSEVAVAFCWSFSHPHPVLQPDVAFEALPCTSFDDDMDFFYKSLGDFFLPLEMCANLISAMTPRNSRSNDAGSNSRSRGLLYFQCAWHDIKETESVKVPIASFSPPPPWFLCVDLHFGDKDLSPVASMTAFRWAPTGLIP